MTTKRSIRILLMTLPALAFWISLVVWTNDKRPGENYWPLIRQVGLFALSLVAFLAFAVTAIVRTVKKRDCFELWVGALANITPSLAFLALWAL